MIWNPWREIRALRTQLGQALAERADFERELARACDRYDKVRDMNGQLREALGLYRNTVSRTDEDWAERIAQLQPNGK